VQKFPLPALRYVADKMSVTVAFVAAVIAEMVSETHNTCLRSEVVAATVLYVQRVTCILC